MMGKEISWEIREHAEDLYIYDQRTYDQVAAETGVSVAQLKRWGADGDWSDQKREYRRSLSAIRRNQVLARKKLIEGAMNSLDPQQVYAFAALEKLAIARDSKEKPDPVWVDPADLPTLNTPADAVDALQQVVELKLGRMLQGADDVSLTKIKEMKQALELIEKMRARYAPEATAAQKGLTDDAAEEIRKQILGINR